MGLSVFLLLPRWFEYRAVRTLIQSLADEKDEPFEAAIEAVKRFDNGRSAVEPLIETFKGKNSPAEWRARYALIQLRDVSTDPVIGTLADTARVPSFLQ